MEAEALELRISELERLIGCTEGAEIAPSDVDVKSLESAIRNKGLDHVLSVPSDKLKSLMQILDSPSMRTLSDKLACVEFAEDLIRQRAQMLEQIDANIKTVLESNALTATTSHAAALEPLEKEVREAVELYAQHTTELETFRSELVNITAILQERVSKLEAKVKEVEG